MASPVSKTVPVQSQHIVQLMQQGWTAVFEPTRIDYATNTLVGALYSDHLPKTKDLLSLDKCVAFKSDGSDTLCFEPDIGEVVACQENQKFMRGQVLEDGRVVLVDLGRTAKPTNYRRLPAEFASVPYLAASLSNLDMDLLNQLSERNAFTVTVSAVTQSVRVTIDDYSVEAELQGWQYNPLTCPDTLISGGQVMITEPADTFLHPIERSIIECEQAGKLHLMSLTLMEPPLHQQLDVIVTQTEPLYVQIKDHAMTYYNERFLKIKVHCDNIQEPYRPCLMELCFAKYEDGHWYRALCMEEGTDLTLMLVDFGNIFNASTRDIRKMVHEFLDFPVLGLPCRISGLPTELSDEQKVKLEKLLPIDMEFKVTFETEKDYHYYISIPSVLSSLLS